MNDTDARLWHPWFYLNRLLRVMLRKRWRFGSRRIATDVMKFDEWLAYQHHKIENLTANGLAAWRDAYTKMCASADAEKLENIKERFNDFAAQNYVAGRMAAVAKLTPIPANLLHHAVEMFLKSALFNVVSPKDLQYKYRHNLKKLWKRFKKKENDPALSQFDSTVRALHAFESIRYPDTIPNAALLLTITWHPSDAVEMSGTAAKRTRKYEVFISDVDGLVLEILKRIPLNPRFCVSAAMVGRSGCEALQYQNPHAADWLTPEERKG
jgi:hypothetical protein